jgi:hypothetical protein
VDLQYLEAARFIGETDLKVKLKTTWSKHRFIKHVDSVCHANDEDVVEGVNTIDLRQQLVNNRLMHACSTATS